MHMYLLKDVCDIYFYEYRKKLMYPHVLVKYVILYTKKEVMLSIIKSTDYVLTHIHKY